MLKNKTLEKFGLSRSVTGVVSEAEVSTFAELRDRNGVVIERVEMKGVEPVAFETPIRNGGDMLISFNLGDAQITVGDTRVCSECGSTNVHDAEDAPEGVVECSDCGVEDYPDEMDQFE